VGREVGHEELRVVALCMMCLWSIIFVLTPLSLCGNASGRAMCAMLQSPATTSSAAAVARPAPHQVDGGSFARGRSSASGRLTAVAISESWEHPALGWWHVSEAGGNPQSP
jgi:hypothetical protein